MSFSDRTTAILNPSEHHSRISQSGVHLEGREYAADLFSRGDRLSLVSCLPEGIQKDVNEYTSFNVYDENDVEYFGLWMTGDFLPRLTDHVYLSSQFEKKLKMVMRRPILVRNQTTLGGQTSHDRLKCYQRAGEKATVVYY